MIETIGDLKKALEAFNPNDRIMVNFGPSGEFHPENSPILEVKQSGATHIVYVKVPYKLICSKCGKFLEDEDVERVH